MGFCVGRANSFYYCIINGELAELAGGQEESCRSLTLWIAYGADQAEGMESLSTSSPGSFSFFIRRSITKSEMRREAYTKQFKIIHKYNKHFDIKPTFFEKANELILNEAENVY